jgi:hypothetical protein
MITLNIQIIPVDKRIKATLLCIDECRELAEEDPIIQLMCNKIANKIVDLSKAMDTESINSDNEDDFTKKLSELHYYRDNIYRSIYYAFLSSYYYNENREIMLSISEILENIKKRGFSVVNGFSPGETEFLEEKIKYLEGWPLIIEDLNLENKIAELKNANINYKEQYKKWTELQKTTVESMQKLVNLFDHSILALQAYIESEYNKEILTKCMSPLIVEICHYDQKRTQQFNCINS